MAGSAAARTSLSENNTRQLLHNNGWPVHLSPRKCWLCRARLLRDKIPARIAHPTRPSVRTKGKIQKESKKRKEKKRNIWMEFYYSYSFLFFFIFGRTETTQGFTKLTVSICFEFLSNNVRLYIRETEWEKRSLSIIDHNRSELFLLPIRFQLTSHVCAGIDRQQVFNQKIHPSYFYTF